MSFVSLKDGQLILDGKSFKFLSFNIPNFAVQEDPWRRTTAFEQEDLLASLSYINATVTRAYTFSFPSIGSDTSKHVVVKSGFGTLNCSWILNEDLMKDLDYGLYLAEKYNIKIILPLIDTYSYWGGIQAFASMFGTDPGSFFTDPHVRIEWLSFVSKILLRNNSFSGINYYSDPSILGWETINEGFPTVNWTLDTAALIKSIDSNHLVIDGTYGLYGWEDEVLRSPLIDIVSNHYYPLAFHINSFSSLDLIAISLSGIFFLMIVIIIFLFMKFPERIPIRWGLTQRTSVDFDPIVMSSMNIPDIEDSNDSPLIKQTKISVLKRSWIIIAILFFLLLGLLTFFILSPILIKGSDFASRIAADCSKLNKKPFLVGELGLVSPKILQNAINYIPSSCSIGGLIWSLRGHSEQGGFHTHQESGGYWSYHVPGFPPGDGFGNDEFQVVNMVRIASKSLFFFQTPKPELSKPFFLQTNYTVRRSDLELLISWKGCAGCSNYTLYGTYSSDNQWEIVSSGIIDNYPSGLFNYKINSEMLLKKYKALIVEGWVDNQPVQSMPASLVNL